MAFDKSFHASIPGISIAHSKLGTLPHQKPPEYTDPDEALEYFFKLLIQPKIQRQIWDILKRPTTDVRAITNAILYKASLQGIIQLNLAIVISPTIAKMISTIAKAGGVNAKMMPDTATPQKQKYIEQNLKALVLKYDKTGAFAGKPSKGNTSITPEAPVGQPQQPQGAASGAGASPQGIAGNAQPAAPNPTQQPTPAPGILGMAPQQPNGGQS